MLRKFIIFIIVFIILLILLNHIEHSSKIEFHKILNKKYYTDYTFEMFEKNQNKEIYDNIEIGKDIAKNSKIVITCLARNIEDNFNNMKKKIEYIGKCFSNYKVVIFENDSEDNSRELLFNWTKENPNIILLDCLNFDDYNHQCKLKTKKGYDYGVISHDRINRMANYREECLKYVKQNLSLYDYMLVVDFDLKGNQSIDGLFHSLAYKNWDAIFINGHISLEGTFGLCTIIYDALAYADINNNLNYDNNNNDFKKFFLLILNTCIQNYKVNTNKCFIPVKSAFNGYGLYKIDSIKDSSYIGNNYCEHLNLNLDLYKKNKKLYINKLWKGYFNVQGPGSLIDVMKSHLKQ